MSSLPKLRALDVRPIVHEGQPAILLRDPLQLSDRVAIVPRVAGPILALCDGTREPAAVAAEAEARFGLRISPEILERLLQALDESRLLDNENFAQAQADAREAFRQAPFRPPALAGASYPADPGELRQHLQEYVDEAAAEPAASAPAGRGLVSPHIDFERGGPVYARVWQRAAEAVRAAELAIVLGTDHHGGHSLNLTRQSYATPFGVLPTEVEIVDELAQAVGPEAAFAGELRHRGEHSIELAAVWLHHMRGDRPLPTVPILTGSFSRFILDGVRPSDDETIEAVIEILRRAMNGRRAIVVAAGDLAHVGPAFGGDPLTRAGRARLKAADDKLVRHMVAGDAEGFLEAIAKVHDRNNVCGVSPIYLALRLLAPAAGAPVAYDHCPADDEGTSVVSVCGVVFD